jgi:hypothetical protein
MEKLLALFAAERRRDSMLRDAIIIVGCCSFLVGTVLNILTVARLEGDTMAWIGLLVFPVMDVFIPLYVLATTRSGIYLLLLTWVIPLACYWLVRRDNSMR